MRLNPWFLIILTCLAVATAGGCRRNKSGALNVVGSTSIQPFAEMLAQDFNASHKEFNVEVQGGGSAQGIDNVRKAIADIGMCSRELKADDPEETGKCDPVVIAYDGLAIVVHPGNPVRGLTRKQAAGIFSGEITNWREVGGEDRPIHVITREEGSGTREAFVKMVMHDGRIFRKAVTQESNGAVKELVRTDKSGIGYMSLGIVLQDKGLKALEIDGIAPTTQGVRDGSYKLKRPFLFVFRKGETPGQAAKAFTEYVLSPAGQRVLEREGLISLTEAQKKVPWSTTAPATSPTTTTVRAER